MTYTLHNAETNKIVAAALSMKELVTEVEKLGSISGLFYIHDGVKVVTGVKMLCGKAFEIDRTQFVPASTEAKHYHAQAGY